MSEDGLLVASDWGTQTCEQLVFQTSPCARRQIEDFAEDHAPSQDTLPFQSIYLQSKDTSQTDTTSVNTGEQTIFGTSGGDCPDDTGKSAVPIASLLSQEVCHHLRDPPASDCASMSLTESQILITDAVLRQEETCQRAEADALTCPICRKDFKTPSELKKHFRSHPPPAQDLKCWQSDCPFLAQDLKRFQSHLRREHKLTPVTCAHRTCRLLFPGRQEMSRHFQTHFPFHCNQCDFISSNSKVFSQHRKSHINPREPYFTLEEPESRPSSALVHRTDDHPAADHFLEIVPPSMKSMNSSRRSCLNDPDSFCYICDVVDHNSVPSLRCRKRRKNTRKNETENPESNSNEENENHAREKSPIRLQVTRGIENGKEHLYKTHMCPECKRCFKKRTHLADHLHLHFPDPNLQCPNCHKFFTSRNKLKIHMMREAGDKVHSCPLCDYSAVEKNALNRHMASIHEGVSNFYSDTYSCPVCQETFKLSQALKDHMKGHKTEQKMRCLQQGCDQALSDRKDFLRHVKESHGIQAVECRYHACSLLFKSREEMEVHRKNHYAFHCQDCDFVCSNKHVFRKHKKCGHPGKEELTCRFCPYKSFNPVEYADHVGKMHANEKIHHCGDCDFATAHKRVLMRHMLLHTGEKPHKCSQCDFVCRDISYLSKHMLTHSTDKNYMCTECGYITKWKHYLNVHMRKHSGDLRYHCNQCSYRCHRADQLSSHKLRHQGKTLICEMCGFGCKRKAELHKHMQVKHSQSPQITMYQCQHCNYQTKYKQTLRNHENGKHTKHREFRCALCSFRTFSNTSLFFHKRKSHGYVPGDQDWLERYASKQQENSSVDLLFPFKIEVPATSKRVSSAGKQAPSSNPAQMVNDESSECMQVDGLQEPPGDAGISGADESLLAAITLEPVEACSIEIEDFPVRLELSESSELLAKESSACEDPLPTSDEILCFSESMTGEDHANCGQDYEEEADLNMGDDTEKDENGVCVTVQYNEEAFLCEVSEKGDELPLHVNSDLELQPGDIPVEVQESWADVVKGGVQLTIVCQSSQLHEGTIQEVEATSVPLDEADDKSSKPESILKALRKQDKEQAEALVLEGRVQMLVVQSNAQVYKCEKCSYITKKKGSIVQHAKNGCQPRKSSLVCQECGASFKQQRGLNTHVLKKCPVRLRKKRACFRMAMSVEGVGQQVDRDLAAGLEDLGSGKESLEAEEHLSQCPSLFQNPIKDKTPERSLDDKETSATLDDEETSAAVYSSDTLPNSAIVTEKYRIEGGKFHCLFCSYSCSRACTISCHVSQNCRELRRAPSPAGLQSEATVKRHKQLESTQEMGRVPESPLDEHHQNAEQEVDGMRVSKGSYDSTSARRLSCPSCVFTCTQERAMKTHKKKGCLKPGEVQCPLCSFRCMSPGALKRHRELHQKYSQNRLQLQCKQCDFTCKQPRCMKQHVRIRHEGIKPHRCRYCDFSTTRHYRLEAHESLHTGVGRIPCGSCSRTFGTNSKLRLHQRRVHEKMPTHFCKLCDYSGYSQNDVVRHVASCHSGDAVYPCSVCQASFSSEAALKQHSLRKHHEKASHECSQCQFSCHSQATLRCHLQKQHLQLECTVCKESFSRREDIEEHRKTHFSHHCQQCQYAAKDRQQLINHYSEEHESSGLPDGEADDGPLRCPFCSFSCRHELVYDHHVKSHGATRVYKCADCDYSTRNKQKITWHSRIHTGEKPYKCHLCTYACADPSRLKYHMRIHKDEKNYLCPECGYKCKWVNQLKYHMTKHTGLKPYQCEECDYCTNRADALRVHRETRHRDVRSFICEQCGKAFKTRFLLKTHLKKHSEEKPYVCNMCQRGFRWPAGLRHHYLTHTNQQPFFCQYCSYRAKQKFQVVKHIQRHHPNNPDLTKGIGKEPYLFSVQGHDATFQQSPHRDGEAGAEH